MPIASTAATASSTLPGPTGSPAARKVRPKCIRVATSRPSDCEPPGALSNWPPLRTAAPALTPTLSPQAGRGRSLRSGSARPLSPSYGARDRVRGGCLSSLLARGGGDLGLDLIEQLGRLAALDAGDVVLVFEQHAQGVVDRLRRQLQDVELHQGLGPVDRLGDAGQFEQIHLAPPLDEFDDLARQGLAGARRLALQDLHLALGIRVIDPVIEAAAT